MTPLADFRTSHPRLGYLVYLLLVVDNCSPNPDQDAAPAIEVWRQRLDKLEKDTACLGELTDVVDLGSPWCAMAFGETQERADLLLAHPELSDVDLFLEDVFEAPG